MTLLILFFLISIAFSFLCSIWEAVLLSITPSFISQQEQEESSIAISLKAFKQDIDKPLSAILTLNTIAHTVGAIGVGAQAGELYGTRTFLLGPIELSMEAIIATVMTLAILILSEIIPKTIGANQWRSLAKFTVVSLKVILFVLTPFVWISQLITKRLKKNKESSVFSRSDFHAMTLAGEKSGALKANESRTIKNLLKLDRINVKSIMTPRSVMFTVNETQALIDVYSRSPIKYSRIPVFSKNKEYIVGILLKTDLLEAIIENKGQTQVRDIMREPQFISESSSLSDFQNKLKNNPNHLALVNDEFGLTIGLVTLEDLMETILGLEIVDEMDDIDNLQEYARSIWAERSRGSN